MWKKIDLKMYDERTQVYLKAYQAQENRHKLIRMILKPFAVLSVLLPPLSLIFTLQYIYYEVKARLSCPERRPSFTLWNNVFGPLLVALLAAFVPIIPGIVSWYLIKDIEGNRRRLNDKIEGQVCSKEGFSKGKQWRKEAKDKLGTLGLNFEELTPEPSKKVKKVKIEQGNELFVLRDRAQKAREEKLVSYGTLLRDKEALLAKIGDLKKAYAFFEQKHVESGKIVEKWNAQYKIK
jgi:hypothetical protein